MTTSRDHLAIRAAGKTDVRTIGTLAHAVWPMAYQNILTRAQLNYMLNLFYAPEALEEQIDRGHHFYIASIGSEPVGFISFSYDPATGIFRIHKLYVHPMVQGKKAGSRLLELAEAEARRHHARTLQLNVNRHNPARDFYARHGFSISGEEDIAIGEDYFMNDFIMEKKL